MIKQVFVTLAIIFFLFISFALGALFYITQQPWVDFSVLEHYNPGKPSILLDNEGNEWTRFQIDRREVISIKQIPVHVINAFVAAEDWNFFKHSGLSFKGIVRSVVVNLYKRRKAQGASTITQQLVRLLFFDTDKSFSRKIKEQIVALAVERQFTKEQILETYLNHVYLGSGIYGVEAACQRFWGKHVADISLDQAAILASIVQSPSRLCPLYNPEATLRRRNIILNSMLKLGFIDQKDYDSAREKPIEIVKHDTHARAPYLKETIRIFLEELFGKELLYTGGLKIQTTINIKMQEAAETIFNKRMTKFREKIATDLEGALISIDRSTGAIKALIGGYSFQQSQFNRALKARRQMGSTFKPLVYATAIAAGKNFAQTEMDEPLTLLDNGQEWKPQNSHQAFDGQMTLARALSLSNNIVTIKTLLAIGAPAVIATAQRCGLKSQLNPYPSLALGCVDSTLQEVTGMINVFANRGIYVEPHCILWIKDEWGKKIWKHTEIKRIAINYRVSSQVAKVLSLAPEQAKKKNPDAWPISAVLGKTGTTNEARTCWFIGSTPALTTGVYIGSDDNRSLGKETYASQTALPIWREFTKQVTVTSAQFSYHPDLKEITINDRTGLSTPIEDPLAISILVSNN